MSCSVAQFSPTLRPHELQHAKPHCPSPSPGVCPSSCPLHQWCQLAISSSDALFSFCPQCFSFCPRSFPASGSFLMSWLFTSGDQNTGASASASVLPVSIQGWFPLRLTDLISLLSKELSGVFSSTTVRRHQFFGALPSFFMVQVSQLWVATGKTIALTIWTFFFFFTIWTSVSKVMSLLFNTLSRFVIAFLPRSNCLLISWITICSDFEA